MLELRKYAMNATNMDEGSMFRVTDNGNHRHIRYIKPGRSTIIQDRQMRSSPLQRMHSYRCLIRRIRIGYWSVTMGNMASRLQTISSFPTPTRKLPQQNRRHRASQDGLPKVKRKYLSLRESRNRRMRRARQQQWQAF